MLMLTLDAKTAVSGAKAGIELCLGTVIPSLLPFFVLSMLLTGALTGRPLPFLRPLGRLCGMPEGSESLLAVGLLGGYPVGAQNVTFSYQSGQVSKQDAEYLLGFCNNAGPAFLFGMVALKFEDLRLVWALWLIHIASAILSAMLLREKERTPAALTPGTPLTLSQALEKALRVMAAVCGWVVLFRVVIAFLTRWFLWIFPSAIQVLISGLLELSNGCCMLGDVENTGLRFLLCCLFLSFGGVCVTMQTVSVTAGLRLGTYFRGKGYQILLSLLLGYFAQFVLLPAQNRFVLSPIMPAALCLGILILKIAVAFPGKMMYNRGKLIKRGGAHAVPKKYSPGL